VSADTLIGLVDGQPERVPLSDVTVLRVREPSPDRTAGLVFLGVTAVGALVVHLVQKTAPLFGSLQLVLAWRQRGSVDRASRVGGSGIVSVRLGQRDLFASGD